MKALSSPTKHEGIADLKPGDLVAGRFRLVEVIGSGGFSVVYRAHQEGMSRFVALKILKPQASADDKLVERFRREALFASQLSHPNTITLFDYGQTDSGLCYIAMEYLVGHDLSEVVKYGDPVEPKRVWSILTQSCRSLSEAHRIGLIHRDLKPENIFLVDRAGGDYVKVLDFGVSKALSTFGTPDAESLAPLTQEGTVFGTPLYMAPEQAMAEEITPAVDVYALGHMAYEMITGRAAYAGEVSAMDVMLNQINDPPLSLPDPWAESPFSELIYRCTLKDPYGRIADAGELLDELMDESFEGLMDVAEKPAKLRHARSGRPLLDLPVADDELEDERDIEDVYRWELSVLDEALDQVRESAETRLVVIRGKPGTGRSNLLRAFLKRHKNDSDLHQIHRQGFLKGESQEAGLEVDLAQAAGLPLKGQGIGEVNRLLKEILADPEFSTLSELSQVRIDSNPLGRVVSQRDDFFSRLIEPFRQSAGVGSLVWGIEDLENVDPLTLAFLERFIRETRVHPAPVLLVVTVHPDALVRRPGLMRYAEQIINAPSSYARHLRLVEPGARKANDRESDEVLQRLAEISSDVEVDGSYSGRSASMPEDLDIGDEELARWAALADGKDEEDYSPSSKSTEEQDSEQKPQNARSSDADRSRQADTGPTQRLEVFTTAGQASAEFEKEGKKLHDAFDIVLGYLAQLDERVVSRKLWEFVYHRVLPFETTRVMGVILEQAERFGIIRLTEESIAFADREYAATLRETFEQRDDVDEAHAKLAKLLHEYAPEPGREDIRRIVYHADRGCDYERAVELLLQAGDQAYEAHDLDLAREYYLQFQSLIDELATRSPRPEVTFSAYPRIWVRVGEIQGALGEYGAAEDALRRAQREARDGDHRLRATALKLLGDLCMAQERYDDARDRFEEAGVLYQQTSLARPYVASLGEIGRCSMLLGSPRKAEGILLQAIDKAGKLQDRPLKARLHRYMGEVLTRQARFLEAVDHLQAAREVFEEDEEHRDVVNCLEELGQAHFAAGLFEKSRDNHVRALKLLSQRHIQSEESPHLGLARALAALKNMDDAESHLIEAMGHYGTRNQPMKRAQVQFHLADLYLATERPKLAEEHYAHVFRLGETIGHRKIAFDALVRRAYALFDSEDIDAAFGVLSEAVTFGEDTNDMERQLIARSHIIYLQLVLHDFQARGDTFSTIMAETDDRNICASQVLCDLFRVDVAVSRGAFREASSLLKTTHLHAASLGEYGLFIPISRRETILEDQKGRLSDVRLGTGFSLGALVPPEAGRRRFTEARMR